MSLVKCSCCGYVLQCHYPEPAQLFECGNCQMIGLLIKREGKGLILGFERPKQLPVYDKWMEMKHDAEVNRWLSAVGSIEAPNERPCLEVESLTKSPTPTDAEMGLTELDFAKAIAKAEREERYEDCAELLKRLKALQSKTKCSP